MKIKAKNWADFQHYKERRPPWIKLHRGILDDYEFHCLPDASRALAPCLWLIASEDSDGVIDADYAKLAFRVRRTPKQIADALKPLIEHGFFIVVQNASNALADDKQGAMPEESRGEAYKTETDSMSGKPDAVAILEFLNQKTGKAFEPVDANLKLILARLKESDADDIRSVIAMKCEQWGRDEKMMEYLRPATLFNATKFAQYKGELHAVS